MFDDIRPYTDAEIPDALRTIVQSPDFGRFASTLAPSMPPAQLAERLGSIRTAWQLQHELIAPLLQHMLQHTHSTFTLEGADRLDLSRPCLFISNHRDIVLDAALLLLGLDRYTSVPIEITFGENLMQDPLLTHFGRANRMFRTTRSADSPLQFSKAMLHLSHYIRHTLLETGHSVWIAQRDGRTKNGLDLTHPSLLKMLASSSRTDPARSLAELNIVPVSVSYEWEPCDQLKARELLLSQQGPYVKAPGEDIQSILTGIHQVKGDIHFTLGQPLTLGQLESLPSGANFFAAAAALIDRQIITHYHLSANNLIAYDLRQGIEASHANSPTLSYTHAQREAFCAHLNTLCASSPDLRPLLLDIYANPVAARRALDS